MDEKNIEEVVEKTPNDLVTIYINNLMGISCAKNETEHYRRILQSINIGSALLPEEYTELKGEVRKIMTDRKTYPEERRMELMEGKYYRLGSNKTGSISVFPDELEVGSIEAINQQCNTLIPRLKEIDFDIFDVLIKERIIKKKSAETEMNETISDICRKKLEEKTHGLE
jgi:hypothetical protein